MLLTLLQNRVARDGGGLGTGFKGRVVYFNRPPELIPVKAKAKVLKRIAKRLKVTAQEAEYAYEWADSVTAGLVSLQHWRDLALDTSNRQLTQPEIRAVSAYWDAVFKASIEVAEDEDLALLLF